jgi:hypothetical protein
MSHEPMHRIIRLKRYEQPPEGYFDDFLREFHRRQRAELLRPSIGELIMERIHAILSEIRVPAMAYAGAAAVAVVASVLILRQPGVSDHPRVYSASYSPASYSQPPVTVPSMQPVSLRVEPPVGDRFDSLFPPSYLLRPRAANHESPLSF